jgi:hypothetical protein
MALYVEVEPLAPIAYALTFLLSIILTKSIIALILDRMRGNFSENGYRMDLGVCGILMLGFSAGYLWQAWSLIPQVF